MDLAKLVRRLTDFEHLCDVTYTPCKMVSTWDKTGGNSDGGDFFRKEGDRAIVADLKGPGALVRFYVARALGLLQFYFDGEERPRLEIDAVDYFSGKTYPFLAPLTGERGLGEYCYIPMPYRKSLRIEALPGKEGRWPLYCQVTYLEFPAGTEVKTYEPELTEEEDAALKEAIAKWNATGEEPNPPAEEEVSTGRAPISPGGRLELAEIDGPAMIHRLRIKLDARNDDVLREALLRAYWDGYVRPSVDAPVGDFFGNGLFFEKYKSLLMGLDDDGYYSYYRMPFGQHAQLEILNEGPNHIDECTYEIAYTKLKPFPENYGYFHAKWRREDTCAVDLWGSNLDGHYNYTFLDTRGQGRYVGCNLNMVNRFPRWWGEGDQMIFVDDDTWPPSHHGTGTEEFFNDAWGFHHGHCPVSGAMNVGPDGTGSGHRCFGPNPVYMHNIADSIPFSKRIRVTLEHGTENDFFNDYASTTYWYQKLPARDFFVMRPVKERIAREKDRWLERYPEIRAEYVDRLLEFIHHTRRQFERFPTTPENLDDRRRALIRWHYNLRIGGLSLAEIRDLRLRLFSIQDEPADEQIKHLTEVYQTLREFTDRVLREKKEGQRGE